MNEETHCAGCGTEHTIDTLTEEISCLACNGSLTDFVGLSPHEDYDEEELWECTGCGEIYENFLNSDCPKCLCKLKEIKEVEFIQ